MCTYKWKLYFKVKPKLQRNLSRYHSKSDMQDNAELIANKSYLICISLIILFLPPAPQKMKIQIYIPIVPLGAIGDMPLLATPLTVAGSSPASSLWILKETGLKDLGDLWQTRCFFKYLPFYIMPKGGNKVDSILSAFLSAIFVCQRSGINSVLKVEYYKGILIQFDVVRCKAYCVIGHSYPWICFFISLCIFSCQSSDLHLVCLAFINLS